MKSQKIVVLKEDSLDGNFTSGNSPFTGRKWKFYTNFATL